MEIQNLYQYLLSKNTKIENLAFSYKYRGEWKGLSYKDYFQDAKNLAKFLLNIGIVKGSKVASITLNRPEWNVLDLALIQIGAIHISIFPNFNIKDISYAINYTDSKILFVSGKLLLNQISKLNLVNNIYTFDDIKGESNTLKNILTKGKELKNDTLLNAKISNVYLEDIASIYLTSGTSGKSKGVVVTHNAIIKTVEAMKDLYQITDKDRALSFAPLCVSSERSLNYYYQSNSICTYYTESMLKIVENMQEVHPTIFLGAPVLLEKIKEKIFEKSKKLKRFKAVIFKWALSIAVNFTLENNLKQTIKFKIADKLVFSKLRQIMGGSVRFILAGGAAIPIEINRFFWALDIPVYEGYGLSECHIIAVNRNNAGVKFGTVGALFGETEVIIDHNGEILCRSPYLFKEYYKMDKLTKESFDEFGFFKTGDKGEWVDNNYLKIIGRVKDIFKIKTGRYISPAHIEKSLNESNYIFQSIIIGANKPFISALIVPSFEYIKTIHKQYNKLSNDDIILDSKILAIFQKEINKLNLNFIESEQIKSFRLLAKEFTIAKGELTPSSKLKRSVIENKHQKTIQSFYDN